MELLVRSDRMFILTTLVTVILVMKVYQTINITLHCTVSCRTCNQGVATEGVPLLQKDVPGLMQKNEEKKQITSLKMHNHATFKRMSHSGDRAHFSPQSGFNPRGTGDPWPNSAIGPSPAQRRAATSKNPTTCTLL